LPLSQSARATEISKCSKNRLFVGLKTTNYYNIGVFVLFFVKST